MRRVPSRERSSPMLLPFWRRLGHRASPPSPRGGGPAGRGGPGRFRPRLEALEDRRLPATVAWISPGGGAWEAVRNWSTGRLPGPTDDVVIDTLDPGAVITHTFDATWIDSLTATTTQGSLAFRAGSLTLAAASTVGNALDLSGGTI